MFNERQTGRSTEQMRAAPRDAIYIWPTSRSLTYAKNLARNLGRFDLRIETPDFIDRQAWRVLRVPVILDHAAWAFMSDRQKTHCIEMDDYLEAALR